MTYTHGCKVTQLSAGDLVRIRIGYPQMSITGITLNSDGKVVLTIAGFEFAFSYVEPVYFPRRPDGSLKHWPSLGKTPTPEELCIGDTIFPFEPRPEDPMKVLGWRNRVQIVKNVYHWGASNDVIVHTITPMVPVSDRTGRPRTYKYKYKLGEQLVDFESHLFTERKSPATPGEFKKAGPYKYDIGKGETAEIWLWIHATGRGRWPSAMKEFELPQTPGTYEMRPPTRAYDWNQLTFTGGTDDVRHPSDLTREGRSLKYRAWKKTQPTSYENDALSQEHPMK